LVKISWTEILKMDRIDFEISMKNFEQKNPEYLGLSK